MEKDAAFITEGLYSRQVIGKKIRIFRKAEVRRDLQLRSGASSRTKASIFFTSVGIPKLKYLLKVFVVDSPSWAGAMTKQLKSFISGVIPKMPQRLRPAPLFSGPGRPHRTQY